MDALDGPEFDGEPHAEARRAIAKLHRRLRDAEERRRPARLLEDLLDRVVVLGVATSDRALAWRATTMAVEQLERARLVAATFLREALRRTEAMASYTVSPCGAPSGDLCDDPLVVRMTALSTAILAGSPHFPCLVDPSGHLACCAWPRDIACAQRRKPKRQMDRCPIGEGDCAFAPRAGDRIVA